jgi:hypothetical protein
MTALSGHLKSWHIAIEASPFVSQRFTLRGDTESMELLCKSVEILHRIASLSTLPEKVLELVHGMSVSGQEMTGLQCLHRGSPLA